DNAGKSGSHDKTGAADADGGSGIRSVNCVRQCQQSVSGTGFVAPKRICDTSIARSFALASDLAIVDGKHFAVRAGRGGGIAACMELSLRIARSGKDRSEGTAA